MSRLTELFDKENSYEVHKHNVAQREAAARQQVKFFIRRITYPHATPYCFVLFPSCCLVEERARGLAGAIAPEVHKHSLAQRRQQRGSRYCFLLKVLTNDYITPAECFRSDHREGGPGGTE